MERAFLEIFNSILGSIREPLVVLDPDLKVIKGQPFFLPHVQCEPRAD